MYPERCDSVFIVANAAFTHAGSSAQDDTTSGVLPFVERTYDIVDIGTATSVLARAGGTCRTAPVCQPQSTRMTLLTFVRTLCHAWVATWRTKEAVVQRKCPSLACTAASLWGVRGVAYVVVQTRQRVSAWSLATPSYAFACSDLCAGTHAYLSQQVRACVCPCNTLPEHVCTSKIHLIQTANDP